MIDVVSGLELLHVDFCYISGDLKCFEEGNAKSLWAAIKSRFGGNDESKKMQRNVLKHQFENFTNAPNESLDKAYDRFQKLISQLEVHADPVSKEDINQKFLRSLPPSRSQIALIMRNKPDIDYIDIDDLYNNLRVYEDEMKRSTSSTSNSQNLAFLSSENTSSTNEVSLASGDFRVSTAGGTSSSSQTTSPQLENEDLSQIDQDDLEELDIRWQVVMLTVREGIKGKGLMVIMSNDFDEPVNYALMAISSSNSLSSYDNEVQNCSKQCLESFKTLQKNNDSEREKHNRARLEIQGYKLALESLESRILRHEKNELVWGEKYEFQNYELNQMSAKDKNGLGYGTQLNEMSNTSNINSEISMSVFEVRSSDEEITPTNNRFSKADGYHVVPPPITGNFLTPRVDISFAGLDKYAIRKKIIKLKTTEFKNDTTKSKTSETIGKTNKVRVEKPKSVDESVVSKPKINIDKVIIKDWNSDDMSEVKTVSHVKTNKTQTVKTHVDKIGQISQKERIGFKKIKYCFVCKSTNHLIKDCDFYDKKNPEPKLKTVVNTSQRVVKPVWDNAKRAKWKRAVHSVSTASPVSTARPFVPKIAQTGSAIRPIYPRMDNDHVVVDSGCSSHMTGNKAYLLDYGDYNGGFVAFGSDPKGGKITGKGKIRTANLDFDDVYFVDELNFKLLDESQVVLRASRQNDVYNLDLKNIIPSRGIKREFSVARTLQQNGVAERKNRTLIEAARTMLANSLLPIPFWADAVNTACYVLNRVLVTKPQNKTPYELLIGSSGRDKEPTQEYILLPLYPHRTRILVEDVVQAAQEKPFENTPKDKDIQDLEDVAEKEEQHTLTEVEQALKDDLERMVAQEIAAKALDDDTSAANTPYASAASTSIGANAGGSSFVYLGGQIPIHASTLPNDDLPINLNMPDLEDDSDLISNDGIFSGAYDDEDVGVEADFNNMDNTIDVSPIPTLRDHKDHPKEEPKNISQALEDESWVEAMQEELLQFKLQKVWILVDLPSRKKAIGTKWDREDVYVHQPPGFVDPVHPNKVYKVKQQPDGIFISQDKSMIGSLMYLTASRPDIIFVVCVYARFQVTPKASHLNVVKRIFRTSMDLRIDGSYAGSFSHIWFVSDEY
ncbi:putative ribonuclease H-like domain-containing protein [Tanacetum coccineum]